MSVEVSVARPAFSLFDPSTTVQVYTTTVASEGVPPSQFLSMPWSVLDEQLLDLAIAEAAGEPLFDVERFVVEAELGTSLDPVYPAQLPEALWYCLTGGMAPPTDRQRESWPADARRLYEYCEYIAYAPIIACEFSPLDEKSLGALIVSGSGLGATAGAAVAGAKVGVAGGVVVGAAGGPLFLVTVPAGFVIGGLVGAVTGVLSGRLLKRFG